MHSAHSFATARQSALGNTAIAAAMDVAFIVVGGAKLLPKARQAAAHLNATSTLQPVRVHLVSDKPLPAQPWFALHMLTALPPHEAALHKNMSRFGVGPSFIYMYKPFLYSVLSGLERVLVLDFDVLLLGDLRELWEQFDAFGTKALLGLAYSQSPEYGGLGTWPHKPDGPRAGRNGGVQLQHLQRMRDDVAAGGSYARDLRRCAAGGCRKQWLLPRLGDQTYYTGLCLREPALCHDVPCQWNRQLSNRFWSHRDFAPWHACAAPTRLAHGNQPLLEGPIFELQRQQRRPLCAECRATFAALKAKWLNSTTRNPRWRWGVDKEFMRDVVLLGCCDDATADAIDDATGPPPPRGAELALQPRPGRGIGGARRNHSGLGLRRNHSGIGPRRSHSGLGLRRNHTWAGTRKNATRYTARQMAVHLDVGTAPV